LFDLDGKVAVVVGGSGVLGAAIAKGLSGAGASVAVTATSAERAERTVRAIAEAGGSASAYALNVSDSESPGACADRIVRDMGGVDILVNCVGGNIADATTDSSRSFFDIPITAVEDVMNLNFTRGVFLLSQAFGKHMVLRKGDVSIVNIASMASLRPLTRIAGYSAAKAAVTNFTQWLAVHLADEHGPHVRVNALAPGFFLTEQNRFLLEESPGTRTARGNRIIDHTPMRRFGEPEDLVGAALWLAGPGSRFVTGIVVPVDGGFSAYAGV
jgi:NAD(P)-dependent dehydrogenase (short-subunit alcohol dehydrogenase family)